MNNILENKNIAFHGINYDYFKLMSILETGVLSQNAAAGPLSGPPCRNPPDGGKSRSSESHSSRREMILFLYSET